MIKFGCLLLLVVSALPAMAQDVPSGVTLFETDNIFDGVNETGEVANDVCYITLPDGRRFAIAVCANSSDTPVADRERAIAEVALMLYDFY